MPHENKERKKDPVTIVCYHRKSCALVVPGTESRGNIRGQKKMDWKFIQEQLDLHNPFLICGQERALFLTWQKTGGLTL